MQNLLSYLDKPKAEVRPICTHLPEDLYIRLKSQCAADRVSLKTMVCRALSQYLDNKGGEQ